MALSYGGARDILNVVADQFVADGETGRRVYLINLTRARPESYGENELYSAIEQIKDGNVMATKYKSRSIQFAPPHVVVFSNEKPNFPLMSLDRWRLHTLTEKDRVPDAAVVKVPGPQIGEEGRKAEQKDESWEMVEEKEAARPVPESPVKRRDAVRVMSAEEVVLQAAQESVEAEMAETQRIQEMLEAKVADVVEEKMPGVEDIDEDEEALVQTALSLHQVHKAMEERKKAEEIAKKKEAFQDVKRYHRKVMAAEAEWRVDGSEVDIDGVCVCSWCEHNLACECAECVDNWVQ